jgi:hypothetical protein
MRLSPRDWFALLGFVSFGFSLVSGQSLSFANVHGTPASAPQQHALSSDGMGGGMKPPESLRLNMDGRDIVTIYATGDVRLADDLTVDEASHEFWRKVGELAPDFCRARAASAN